MGKVACQTIVFGRGVCGTAADRKEPVVVENVEEFPGHIACDGASKSETVVPILKEGVVCPTLLAMGCLVANWSRLLPLSILIVRRRQGLMRWIRTTLSGWRHCSLLAVIGKN